MEFAPSVSMQALRQWRVSDQRRLITHHQSLIQLTNEVLIR